MRIFTLVFIGAAFLINFYGLGTFAYAMVDVTLHHSPDTQMAAIWGWDILWSVIPGLVTLIALALAFILVLRKVR